MSVNKYEFNHYTDCSQYYISIVTPGIHSVYVLDEIIWGRFWNRIYVIQFLINLNDFH